MRSARFPERGSVEDRLAGFLAHLRANGFPLGIGDLETAQRALAAIDPTDRAEVKMALRAVCASGDDRNSRFSDLFDAWWLDHGRNRDGVVQTRTNRERIRPAQTTHLLEPSEETGTGGAPDAPDDEGSGDAETDGKGRLAAVRKANVRKKDLRTLMTPQDISAAEKVATDLARAMRDRRSRRRKARKRGAQLDLRRIVRRSVAHGGEPFDLLRKHRPDRAARIVTILDVSGSMSVYARVFLAFIKGLASVDRTLDAYLLHTRLVRITDALKGDDAMAAIGRMSLMANGFGGGTRLGAGLSVFVDQYARHAVNSRTVVIILSDGYDTDPPEMTGAALARLKRRGCRIIWLNPLKGWQGYEPVARAMAAALPHLDLFAPANTLDSLAALEPELACL